MDIWPYSGRENGRVTDAEHGLLWSPIADGILPGEGSTALETTVSGSTWTTQPGRIHINGRVLHIDEVQSGPVPAAASATRYVTIAAYVDTTQSPWTYGVRPVLGVVGGGPPSLPKPTGAYEVPLMTFTVAATGAVTVRSDDRVFLDKAGKPMVTGWRNLSLVGAFTSGSVTPQYRLTFDGKRLEFRGQIRRNDGGQITGAANGSTLATFPSQYGPNVTGWMATGASLTGTGTAGAVRVDVTPGGQLVLWTQDTPTWVSIDGGVWRD